MSVYKEILFEVDDPVATITLNRPSSLNAWTDQMGFEVRHAVAKAERDPRVVGIVITGAGRGFCSGADMSRLSAVSAGNLRAESRPMISRPTLATPPLATICTAGRIRT